MSKTDLLQSTEQIIGYSFSDHDLLHKALTHASVANSRVKSNERLEFLGDAILGAVVCEDLYRRFESWLEGDLTKLKSVVVSRRVCAKIADELGLTQLLILGNGVNGATNVPTSLRAAVVESIIGALFLDGGYDAAKKFILAAVAPHIDDYANSEDHDNYKSALQQYAQRHLSTVPHYVALDEQGPDHSKCFEICVTIGDERFPSAWGPSKKEAEQEAARKALETLKGEQEDGLASGGV